MWYSIIPPILIVLSLVGIIILIMKKAPLLKKNSDSDLRVEKKRGGSGTEFLINLKNKFSDRARSFRAGRESKKETTNYRAEKVVSEVAAPEEKEKFFSRRNTEGLGIRKKEVSEEPRKEMTLDNSNATTKENRHQNEFVRKDLFEKILIDRIAANPKDVEAYERLGEYYLEIESWEDAKECLKQVLKLNPRNMNVKIKMRKLERLLSK